MLMTTKQDHLSFLPDELTDLENPQTDIPRIAKDENLLSKVEFSIQQIPTHHDLFQADSRRLSFIPDESVHLVVTSPPYWTLKKYRDHEDQLGSIEDYEYFLKELDKVWEHCYRALIPGGRVVCVVGDVRWTPTVGQLGTENKLRTESSS